MPREPEGGSTPLSSAEAQSTEEFLRRLNHLSLTRSFTPEIDIDWDEVTTDAEFESLYPAWSLLQGSGLDASLDAEARRTFVRYQQINLMMFTALLERHAIAALARLYDLDGTPAFSEYVGHFIKEEIYHYTMFLRAIGKIQAGMPGRPQLPAQRMDRALRWLFRLLGFLPGRKLRVSMTFTIFRFAEQVTICAHKMVQSRISRRESLIRQVWAYHALDEARHVVFDSFVLERCRLRRPLGWLHAVFAAPCCILLSMCLNANELWISRQLGIRIHIWRLPDLMRRTTAPFKRQVFDLLGRTARGLGRSTL